MINRINKKVRGISLISLVIAITVLMILTSVIIYYVKDSLKTGELRAMQNDIANLRDKISVYYAQNGQIPASIKYTNIDMLKTHGVISATVDTGDFLVIDLSAIENLTLNYGMDFEKVKEQQENANEYKDLYIINETSHNIFYVEGIKLDNEIFYTDYTSKDIDLKSVDLRYKDGVKIPEGFYYVGGTKDTGIVISDVQDDDLDNTKRGNQFVWVPVPNIDDFHTIGGYRNGSYDTGVVNLSYVEPYENGYSTEVEEYNKMKESVEFNKGFFIGRFEAGKDEEGNVVVQKNRTVYNQIGWSNSNSISNEDGGAVALSKNFARDKNSVISNLCYGVQWDATMQFIDNNYIKNKCSNESYVKNSFGKGNYSQSLISTGSNEEYKVKNIYDMAGNVFEWTMEAMPNGGYRVYRGGGAMAYGDGGEYPASFRGMDQPDTKKDNRGFRIALYLNGEESWSPVYDQTTSYKDKNGNTAIIPGGFQVSQKQGENLIETGLVVKASDGSEFVWVPVEDINTMAIKTTGKDSNGRDNYQGKLYEFSDVTSKEMTNYGQGTSKYREPTLITGSENDTSAVLENVKGTGYDCISNYYRNILGYNSVKDFGKDMQEEYNAMIESVKKYGGFYIGRYETSINGNTVAAKKNVQPMTEISSSGNLWYGMFKKQKEFASKNSLDTVGSSMIWGSQYDAMLNWVLKGKDKDKVTNAIESENYNVVNTGITENDKINSIYDLIGNLWEVTLEGFDSDSRLIRGGCYGGINTVSSRVFSSPILEKTWNGSRMTLYIK